MDFLSLSQDTHLRLHPQLLQSVKLLQMNSQELSAYLHEAAEENPVLELSDPAELLSAYQDLRRENPWISMSSVASPDPSKRRSEMYENYLSDRHAEIGGDLVSFLCDQLERLQLPKSLLTLCQYIAALTDENGYLAQEDLDDLIDQKISFDMVLQALSTLQSLEPAGVCARSLSECLSLQIQRDDHAPSSAAPIAARFLSELSRGHYGVICKALQIEMQEVYKAQQYLVTLNPYPGAEFQNAVQPQYIRPDFYIIHTDGQLEVVLNEFDFPSISINSYYAELLKKTTDDETREYLHQKIRQVKWLISGMENRSTTLKRCAEEIAETQQDFFFENTTMLKPLRLKDVAQQLDIHVSTVSRAIKGKYLQCRQGIYPLHYFFTRAVNAQEISQQAVKQHILTLIQDEDPAHPLSDQAICILLRQRQVTVARRTVAKYREELEIPSSAIRRKRR